MKDILLEAYGNFELVFKDGDFATGDSLEQAAHLLLDVSPGELKLEPTKGVALGKLAGASTRFVDRLIRVQFEAEKIKIDSLTVDKNVQLDASV